ncbi:MAG: hypothetical protein B6245_01350 [Desulfobacteraceae bacterium 4572_88]|nr:MAG: hypothetical protein B6245_01350 [Desulfobacteraceae bacterium 4572_88]
MDTEIVKNEKDGFALLSIIGSFSIYEATRLRDEFIRCFDAHKGLILDLGEVSECDTAGVQLLCSARRTAQNEGKGFAIEKPSKSVINAVTSIGLDSGEVLEIQRLSREALFATPPEG